MDFLKTLLAYMAVTFVVAVESTSTPAVTPVPTPAPATTATAGFAEVITEMPTAEITATPTVSVTPVPVPTITPNMKGYHNLLQGDRGDDVRKLQERLIELGYLPEGSADGAFGGKTRNAVRKFQYYNGLTVDGIAGRTTQTNLFENPDAAPMPTPEPTPTPTPEPAPTPETAPVPEENGEQENEAAADESETAEILKNNGGTEAAGEKEIPETDKEQAESTADTESTTDAAEPAEISEPTVTPYVVTAPTEIPWGDEITAFTGEKAEDGVSLKADEELAGELQEETVLNPETESDQEKEAADETDDGSGTETETASAGKPEGDAVLKTETESEPAEEETAGETEKTSEQEAGEGPDSKPEAVLNTESEPGQTEEEKTGRTEEAAEPEEEHQQSEEIIEEVDLDAEEAAPVPESTAEPELIEYEELAGWVILNDGEEALQWTETEEDEPAVRSPRMERKDDDFRISLDDLVKGAEGWALHDETDSVILEAQGYTLALLNEKTGFVAMVDGTEIETDVNDFSFDEGHFIRVDFLTRALEGSWEWDAEEETLLIRIPEKGKDESSQ